MIINLLKLWSDDSNEAPGELPNTAQKCLNKHFYNSTISYISISTFRYTYRVLNIQLNIEYIGPLFDTTVRTLNNYFLVDNSRNPAGRRTNFPLNLSIFA